MTTPPWEQGRASPPNLRPVWAEIDLDAIRHNAGLLARLAAPAQLCAVVKAGAYGHGPVPVARAALNGGASWLAVAMVEEGAVLRDAGIEAPILLLSEPPSEAMNDVVGLALTPTLYTETGVTAADAAYRRVAPDPTGRPFPVHVKVDTGMRRVGASPAETVKLALKVQALPQIELAGIWTHFAVADDPEDPFTTEQNHRFQAVLADLAGVGIRPRLIHSCNSAALLAGGHPHYDMVRCGIAVFGVPPSPALAGAAALGTAVLRPALSLRARVSHVKEVARGEGVSYGLRYRTEAPTVLATVPVGYADGVPWRLGLGGAEVLVRGHRRPVAGSVTMDQIMIDCGPGSSVSVGDEVVLVGRQGDEEVDAWECALHAGTIAYEVLCGVGPRVPRVYVEG